SVAPDSPDGMESFVSSDYRQSLECLTGPFEVTYNVWNQADQPCDTFYGRVDYQWCGEGSTLVGQHDGNWGGMPFTSAFLVACDETTQTCSMGWSRADGTTAIPMQSTDPYSPYGEFSVTRDTQDSSTKSVLTINDTNSHTIQRYSTDECGEEHLVLEIICTRQ
ncbi:MAG: DUF1579 family protein, partial [Planctomycetes bacterium]|nr:DUF1579 family protein [Planctomycetota bacterium]